MISFSLRHFQAFRNLLQLLTRHRQLIKEMTWREVTQRYVGHALGMFWTIGQPLFLMAVYVFVFSYVFIALSMVLSQSLNGAGSTKTPMLIDIIGLLFVQIPLALYLSRNLGLGLTGIWYAIVASNVFIAVLYVVIFKLGRWKKKELW